MENSEVIFKKKLPRCIGLPVCCDRYLIVDGNPRHAYLSFVNSGDYEITGICFTIRQFDANGKMIHSRKKELYGLSIMPEAELGLDETVFNDCEKIDIQVESVLSQSYEYIKDGDRVNVVFCGESRGGELCGSQNHKVTSKVKKPSALMYVFAIIVFIIAFVLAIVGGVLKDNGIKAEPKAEFYAQVGVDDNVKI